MEIEGMRMPAAFVWAAGEANPSGPVSAADGRAAHMGGRVEMGPGPAAGHVTEEAIQAVLGELSEELADQARLDRLSIQAHREKCRAMRREVLRQMRAMRAASRKKRRRGLLAKIFKWVAAALAAVAAAAAAVFTGGGSMAAYGIAVGAAVAAGAAGVASGGTRIATGMAAARELDAAAGLDKARMARVLSQDMQEELLSHLGHLYELDARIGTQARSIMSRYDSLRQQSLEWR
jgi:hypothetical protein